jgi:TRAP-type mannitol/chloroaromatic compound transport system substrate-binding protein
MAWYYVGDGMKLCNEAMKDFGYVIGMSCDTAELFCHSNVKIETQKDLKGIKFRTYGLWAEILKGYGASVVTLPGGEIYSAAERKVIDAFEFRPPAADWTKGFHEITKYIGVPGIHSPNNPHIFLVNKKKWDSLPSDLQTLLKDEIFAWALHRLIYAPYDDGLAMEKYKKYGTELVTVSDELQRDIARRVKEWCEKTAAKDANFKKVYENQMTFFKTFRVPLQVVSPRYSIYD